MSITTVIIAKDEADRIGNTIASVLSVSDEVLVLDTGSTDSTVSVSEQAGARVVTVEWQGYGTTKNIGISLAKNDWILSLDADEVLSKKLQEELININPVKGTVYMLNRIVRIENQWIRYSGWHPDWVCRLFHREECVWNDNLVHEKIRPIKDIKKYKLIGLLEHHSYRSLEHFRTKIDQYAILTAHQWIINGKSPSLLKRYFGKSWKYINMYYLKKGYRDGKIGKIIAKVQAEGVEKKIKHFDKLQIEQAKTIL